MVYNGYLRNIDVTSREDGCYWQNLEEQSGGRQRAKNDPVFQAMLRFAQQCFYGVKGRGGRKMSGKNFKPYAPTFIPTMHRKPITNRLIVKSKQGGEMWIVWECKTFLFYESSIHYYILRRETFTLYSILWY